MTGFILSALALLPSEHTSAQNIAPMNWIVNGAISEITTDSTYTYVGGIFTYVGPSTGRGVKLTTTTAAWDINFPKVNGRVNTAVPDGSGGWFIGGEFTKVDTTTRYSLAHILSDGTVEASWNPTVLSGAVNTIAISGNSMYIGGLFSPLVG